MNISRIRNICHTSDFPQSVHFEGVVAYNDRNLDFLLIQDDSAGIRVRPLEQSTIPSGHRVAVSGRTGTGQDADFILDARVSDLGGAKLRRAIAIAASNLTSDRFDGQIVSITGVIHTFWQGYYGQARAEMNVGGPQLAVFVQGGVRSEAATRLEDAEVSVTGLLSSSAGLDGRSFTFSLLVPPDLSWIRVLKPPPDLRKLPSQSVERLLTLPDVPSHRIRVRGTLPLDGYTEPILSDGAGRIAVMGEVKYEAGTENRRPDSPIDLVAFVGVQGTRRVLTEAFVVGAQGAKAKLSPLTSADALLRLTANQALGELPVSLDAVVTFYDPRTSMLFIHDSTAGVYVTTSQNQGLRAGDHILVSGVSGPGAYSPIVNGSTIRVIGRAPLPEPLQISQEDIFLGGAEEQWVELDGIIRRVGRSAGEWFADTVWGAHHYTIRVSGPTGVPASWIDAHVRVRGACGSTFNSKRQFVGTITLFVPGLDQITVVDPAPSNAFQQPAQPIKDLLQYLRSASLGHRVRIRGTVTAANLEGPTWIQDNSAGVMIGNHDKILLSVGDVVDVAGFVSPGPVSPELHDARVSKLRAQIPLQPATITGEEGLSGTKDAKLVRIDAKLLNRSSNGNETILLMQAGRFIFSVHAGTLCLRWKLGPSYV